MPPCASLKTFRLTICCCPKMCIKLCFSSMQCHAAEVVPLGHPHLNPVESRPDMLNRQTCPPPSWRRDLSLPILLCTIMLVLFQQPPIPTLDKLGGFTKSHFPMNCDAWVGNIPEHRPRAKLLVVYSYGLLVFYTITSMPRQHMTPSH